MKLLQGLTALCLVCLAAYTANAWAQGTAYPARPVMVVAAIAPGGPVDREARVFTNKINEFIGQPFVLDFKPGAGGTIGTGFVAKAAPDGYTLLVTGGNFTLYPLFYKDLPFDIIKDLAPISLMSQKTTMLLVRPSFPANNVTEYIAYARANPGKINFGMTGSGGVVHLAGEWLHSATDTKVTFIAYKGAGPLFVDMVAGRIDVTPASIVSAWPLVKSGKLRLLAIASSQRSPLLPGVATVAEQGVPGYDYTSWMGFIAPGPTPAAIVNRLSEAFAKVAKSRDIADTLEPEGSLLVGSTPAQFRQLIASEAARWRKLVEERGIKMEE